MVDVLAAAMVVVADMAAQKAPYVRIVVKRGNHDEDSYLTLLMAMKYRYISDDRIIVEQDPSPYWAHSFGDVLLFGHHGDRIKPETLIMKMAADHRELFGKAKHTYLWTGDKHHWQTKDYPGVTWEQAACWTEPDAYGAAWGAHAKAKLIVYEDGRGERERYTVAA